MMAQQGETGTPDETENASHEHEHDHAYEADARLFARIISGTDATVLERAVNAALATGQGNVDGLRRREKALSDLSDVVSDLQTRRLPAVIAELERNHAGAGLTPAEWQAFNLTFTGDPNKTVGERLVAVRAEISRLAGPSLTKPAEPPSKLPPYIMAGAELSTVPLSELKAEAWRPHLEVNRQAPQVASCAMSTTRGGRCPVDGLEFRREWL